MSAPALIYAILSFALVAALAAGAAYFARPRIDSLENEYAEIAKANVGRSAQ